MASLIAAVAAMTAAILAAPAPPPNVTSPPCPLLLAHQGYTGSGNGGGPVPANSVAAVSSAARSGARVVEFDVRWSADGVPVIIHNPTVDGTTAQRGPVARYPARALERMRLRSARGLTSQYLPTLVSMLQAAVRAHLRAVVQIKTDGVSAAHVASFTAAVNAARARNLVSIHSFYPASLSALRYPAVLLTEKPVRSAPGAAGVDLRGSIVTAALVARLHAEGLTVGAWTSPGSGVSDTSATWVRLAAAGVDRIITNDTAGYAAWCRSR